MIASFVFRPPGFARWRPCSLVLLALALLAAATPAAQVARRIVSDNGDPILYPSYLKEFDGKLYFRANNIRSGNNVELWEFDGTVAHMTAEINPGTTGSDPSYLAVCNGRLYFCASTNGGASRLWQYDPAGGASLAPGSASSASLPQEMFAYGGNLYFRAARFGAPGNIGIELWKFDGASQTPIDLFAGTGSSYPQHFIEYNGLLYFNACGAPGQGSELWRYNGTGLPAEAARVYPDNGSSPENFAVYDGQLYFSAYDGVHGRELWRYNGTSASLAADIVPGVQYSSSNPSGLTAYNGKLYFCATDEVHGYELWAYDGTDAQMVAEINPTPDPGNGDTFLMDSSPANLTVFGGLLYFSANDGVHGRELWSFDGTTARLALDINPGPCGSEVSELTVFNGALYFAADDGFVPGLSSLQPAMFALAKAEPPTLEQALDTTGVVWTTGSHPWLGQAEVTHDGADAAVSGQVHNADDHSWLKATNIIGPACVTFRWKAQMTCGAFASFSTYSSGAFSQSMSFYPTADWQWETFFLGEGPQELLWRTWGNCDDPNQILLWVDEVVIIGPGQETAPFFTTLAGRSHRAGGNQCHFHGRGRRLPLPDHAVAVPGRGHSRGDQWHPGPDQRAIGRRGPLFGRRQQRAGCSHERDHADGAGPGAGSAGAACRPDCDAWTRGRLPGGGPGHIAPAVPMAVQRGGTRRRNQCRAAPGPCHRQPGGPLFRCGEEWHGSHAQPRGPVVCGARGRLGRERLRPELRALQRL